MSDPIGIFGGTFDPLHFGHLRLAQEASSALHLKHVLWVPAGLPPHRAPPLASRQQRLRMVEMAIANNTRFILDASEIESDRPSYTVDTFLRLRQEMGSSQPLVLLIGADALLGLPTWHRWQELLELTHFGIATRPQHPLLIKNMPADIAALWQSRQCRKPEELQNAAAGLIAPFEMTALDISATRIRSDLKTGLSPRYLLPDPVLDYIELHQLYR